MLVHLCSTPYGDQLLTQKNKGLGVTSTMTSAAEVTADSGPGLLMHP